MAEYDFEADAQKLKQRLAEHKVSRSKRKEREADKEAIERRQLAKQKELEKREEARKELARRDLARRHLIPFIVRFKPNYQVGWVHKVFAAELERFFHDVEAGKQPRLMVFVPPRHGKSEIISNNFPSWVLGHHPEWEVIMASYSVNLPLRFSRANRARIKDSAYKVLFPETELDRDSTSAEEWLTTKRGGLKCAGVGGGLSGFGANILIIDDPIKDYEDAQSATIRETAKNWYTTVAETRLAPEGGVICVQCMTGDTPVLMGDGSEQRLDTVRPGDMVASYDGGRLVTSKVLNWASQGYDSVFRITTSSGRMVKANKRHPFLIDDQGELKWVRLGNLRSTQQIVVRKGSGESGKAKLVLKKGVKSPLGVKDFVIGTTTNTSGLVDTVRRLREKILHLVLAPSLSTDTELRSISTSKSWLNKAASALFAKMPLMRPVIQSTGTLSYASTTATTATESEGFSAINVTLSSVKTALQKHLKPQQNTFETEEIVAIDYVGEEEVFDIQVERTENFVANGLVSHNTRWHDDDLSGWQLRTDRENREEGYGEELLQNWRVVSFPAIAEADEYIDPDTLEFHEAPAPGRALIRPKGEALHPDRYPLPYLMRKKINMPENQWNALFQQNPVPDSGDFFRDEDFMYYHDTPVLHDYPVVFSWDLAIGEKRNNDYTVGLAGLVVPQQGVNALYLLDMYRNRVRDMQQLEAIVSMYAKYKNNAYRLGVEQGTIWLAIEKRLRALFEERNLTPVFDETLVPVRDKRVRATPLQGWMQNHRVYFPKNQPWVSKAREELLRFDAGVHDDVVDALAWMVRMVQNIPVVESMREKRKHKTVKELLADYARDQGGQGKGYMAA